MSELRAGVAGLGAMGEPMARNLHQVGLLAAVWNRTTSKAKALARELGVENADSPETLARECDLIIVCVSADDDVREVCEAMMPGLQSGNVVVDTSTVSQATALEMNDLLATQGVGFLDAPVSGGVEGAKKGTLSMMVGGEAEQLEKARPALEAMTSRITHMGTVGSGQATKAVNQVMVAGIAQAVCEALAFGERLGLDGDQVVDVLSGGAAGNWFLDHRGQTMLADNFTPGFKLGLLHKDLGICQSMAAELGGKLPLVEMSLIHYGGLMKDGFAADDTSALIRQKRTLFD